MAKFNYKVTDIEALSAAYPQAVVTIKSPNRQEIGKLVRASKTLGVSIPGVEVFEVADALDDVPAHMKGDAASA